MDRRSLFQASATPGLGAVAGCCIGGLPNLSVKIA